MRKALIVDDEILSIRMLTQIIDWNQYGIRICATAEDGAEALEQFEKHWPDIILTDIRMPRMDGLEFIRQVKERRPETEFILISGYADFSYVKKAMGMGCSNYILKPVDEVELEGAIRSLMDKIDKKERQEEIMEEHQRLKIRRKVSYFMRTGGGSADPDWFQTHIPQGLSYYRLVGIMLEENSINDHVEHASRLSLEMETMERQLEEYLNGICPCLLLDYDDGCWTVMVSAQEELSPSGWADALCGYFLETFQMAVHICFTLPYREISQLPVAFARLSNLQRFSFYVGEVPVLGYGYNCEENEFEQLDILDRTKVIGRAIEAREIVLARQILDEVLEQSIHLNPASLHLVYEFCYNVVCAIREQFTSEEALEKLNQPVMKLSYRDVSEIATVGELGEFMDQVLNCLESSEAVQTGGGSDSGSRAGVGKTPAYGRMVQDGIHYLEEHFDSNISLDSMCLVLAVSKNYFCYLFKRETGQNIWSYLTQIRLAQSQKLLLTTDYKSYEIAYMVGYDNPSYFSRLFKKCTGQTPNEYRAAHGNEAGRNVGGNL